jgi:hypothetical protein
LARAAIVVAAGVASTACEGDGSSSGDPRPPVAPQPAARSPSDAPAVGAAGRNDNPPVPSAAPKPEKPAADGEVFRAADALLASCTDREKRLVEETDWTRMRKQAHLEVIAPAASSKDAQRRWTRMLVPLVDPSDVRVYVADGEDYFSAYTNGSPALRDALAKALGR